MGEVENIGPGLTRQLIVSLPERRHLPDSPASRAWSATASARTSPSPATRLSASDESGQLAEAADGYKRYVTSQVDALQETTGAVRRRGQGRQHRVGEGAVPDDPHLLRAHRAGGGGVPRRTRPASSTCGRPTSSPASSGPASTASRRTCGSQGLQPDTNAIADQLLVDVQELADQVNAEDFTIDPIQIAGGAPGLLDEISHARRSPVRRTSSPTPTCGTSRPTSTARRPRSRHCTRSSTNATPISAPGITQRFADARRGTRPIPRGRRVRLLRHCHRTAAQELSQQDRRPARPR